MYIHNNSFACSSGALYTLFLCCDSEINKVQRRPLRVSHQLFLLLPHWLPSAQIKSEAQPTPQGIWYYSENTDALLARVRSLLWEHIPLPGSETEWIRSMSDTGSVLLTNVMMLFWPGNELEIRWACFDPPLLRSICSLWNYLSRFISFTSCRLQSADEM